MDTFDDRLNVFFTFCESDPAFSAIHKQLMEIPSVDLQSWLDERSQTGGSFVGSKQLTFPPDEEQRLALMYQLLYAFRSKSILWTDFAINFFSISGSRVNDFLDAINDAITYPLVRDLEYRLEDVEDDLPSEETQPVGSSVVQIIHNATNVINQTAIGSGNTQNASIHHSEELVSAFNALRELIKLKSEDRENDLDILEAAESAATAPEPKSVVVGALLQGLSVVGSASSMIGTIMQLLP